MNGPAVAAAAALREAPPSAGSAQVPASAVRWPELRFDNRYARLPAGFHSRLAPAPLPSPRLVAASTGALELLGLDRARAAEPAFVDVFAGNRPLLGADPLAAVYSGHQFGVWAGQLGDGRALLLGEVARPQGGVEIQLKGAGPTPYARGADGRAVLRSSIREFLGSEAMAALGIPTTRALALVASELPVQRESVETAAVVTRLAPSFVRFGSFEHFFACGRHDDLQRLADHVIDRAWPALADEPNPYLGLLGESVARTARLVAQWQAVGFCHGVMNTDNMSVLGLTIDYGPFGFLDGFDFNHVCNHSDHAGRYSYAMQPRIAEWNCWCLGQALLPLVTARGGSVDDARAVLGQWEARFDEAWLASMRAKLGLAPAHADAQAEAHACEEDRKLIDDLLALLHAGRLDFTLFFRRLAGVRALPPDAGDGADAAAGGAGPGAAADDGTRLLRELGAGGPAFEDWLARYRRRLALQPVPDAARAAAMNRVTPKFVLRNHLAEVAIRRAREGDDGEVRRLLRVLERPYDEQPGMESYADLPPAWAAGLELSCSS